MLHGRHLELRSKDPTQPPAIFANYFDNEADQQTLVKGMNLAQRLSKTDSLARFTDVEALPGPQLQSDREIIEYLRTNARSFDHLVGSCKMGQDEMAVVDEQHRVRGTEGLRVVDASIMPTITHANTNAPTIMIAEKAADLITHSIR